MSPRECSALSPAVHPITVVLTPEEKRHLDGLAGRLGISKSGLVRLLISLARVEEDGEDLVLVVGTPVRGGRRIRYAQVRAVITTSHYLELLRCCEECRGDGRGRKAKRKG